MFEKILVPVDGSAFSEQIVDDLQPILQLDYPELHLLRVIQPLRLSEYERKPKEANEYLEGLTRKLSARRAKLFSHVEIGDPAAMILGFAAEHAVSLVAMSTHGHGGMLRWVRGSVAERVLRRCPVPVLLTNKEGRAETQGFRRILVPLDGSDTAAQVLPLVKEIAPHFQSEVTLLCVEQPQVVVSPFAVPDSPPISAGRPAAEILAPFLEELRETGLQAKCETAVGPPAEWILETARSLDTDLLAMTTHGRSGPSRWLFGSVAEKVIRKSPCPLLVQRIKQESE